MLQKNCEESKNTHFLFNIFFFETRDVYEILWTNIAQPGRPQMSIWCMRIACCIAKATDTWWH